MKYYAEKTKQQIRAVLKLLGELGSDSAYIFSEENEEHVLMAENEIKSLRSKLIQIFLKQGFITEEEKEEFFNVLFIKMEHNVEENAIILNDL